MGIGDVGEIQMAANHLGNFLAETPIIDWKHPDVYALALKLGAQGEPIEIAGRCFEWVRDEISHSADHQVSVVTCKASEVLRHRTGLCYAKSHLLAALLRANGFNVGFVYQRLSIDDSGPPFCLHGLNAVFLPEIGWYRVDPRGNRPDISTRFTPPVESLAFYPKMAGEMTFETIWPEPLPVVIQALQEYSTVAELMTKLPDWNEARLPA